MLVHCLAVLMLPDRELVHLIEAMQVDSVKKCVVAVVVVRNSKSCPLRLSRLTLEVLVEPHCLVLLHIQYH